MTSRARARVAGVVGRPDLEGAEVWLLHHYDRDARWLTRNIITQEEIALRECSLSAPTPIGCCQGLPEELLEMAFVSGHAEAPPFVLCTVARVCSTLRTLVALRYPALLRCATLAATPGVVRHSLRRRLYEHERAGNEYLIAYIARVAMCWPWAIDNTVTPHTRYPLSAFANETRTLGLYMRSNRARCVAVWKDEPFYPNIDRVASRLDTCEIPTPFAHLQFGRGGPNLAEPRHAAQPDADLECEQLCLLDGLKGQVGQL